LAHSVAAGPDVQTRPPGFSELRIVPGLYWAVADLSHCVTMATVSLARPMSLKALVVVQALLAVVAIPSGALLLADPSGRLIGGQFILPYLTKSIPFIHDFAPVGTWLIAVYGALPILFDFGLLKRARLAWLLTTLLGFTVLSWVGVEIALFYAPLGFTPLYPLIGGIGAATAVLCLVPSVRRFFSRDL
jgi:hypothetical protein